ncbi:adenylate/guanylate cyclase domain-containing protein [Agaribacter flavus]|uniref:Adenylate/guanylate cyclase domain-containing protein n=1 Tax=Agaribacter flavus TaxID=1902781 RepID=A0ABV7FMF1_9ALTE
MKRHSSNQQSIVDKLAPPIFDLTRHSPTLFTEATEMQTYFCSVAYLDLVNSTQLIKEIGEQNALTYFHQLFVSFDAEAQNFDAFRVKTNGDQYIFVVGLHENSNKSGLHKENALKACQLVNVLSSVIEQSPYYPSLNFRAGIASGAVYAGIINPNYPNFDIWGETVIRASRLETHAKNKQILLDEQTRQFVRGTIPLNTPKHTSLKGLGSTMYVSMQPI